MEELFETVAPKLADDDNEQQTTKSTTAKKRTREDIVRQLKEKRQKQDDDPMDVDVNRVYQDDKGNMYTGEEMMGQGRCFNCMECGHLSRDCPKPKKAPVKAASKPAFTLKKFMPKASGSKPKTQGRDRKGRFTQIRLLQAQGAKLHAASNEAWTEWTANAEKILNEATNDSDSDSEEEPNEPAEKDF